MKIKVSVEMSGSKKVIEAWQATTAKGSWLSPGYHDFDIIQGPIKVYTTHTVLERDPLTPGEKVTELRKAVNDALDALDARAFPKTYDQLTKALQATE